MKRIYGILVVLCLMAALAIGQDMSNETANNTSGALTATQSNGNQKATNISKVDLHSLLPAGNSNKPILAVYQPWFKQSNHMDIGLDEHLAPTVQAQVDDAISRGISGFMVNWYGQPANSDKTSMDNITKNVRDQAEARPGFTFALQYDGGAYKSITTDKTAKFIADMKYARANYFSSPAYLKVNGRPVVEMFSVDEDGPVDWTKIRAAIPELLMLFRNSGGWSHAQSDGMYGWVGINANPTTALSYDTGFYLSAKSHTDKIIVAPIWAGFNDSLAAWGQNRITPRNCGQVYLKSWADAAANISSVDFLELNTWNDYEEGTELETGVDGCVSVTATLSSKTLSWTVTNPQSAIDHFTVFAADVNGVQSLGDVPATATSFDLGSVTLKPSTYSLYVKAVGKPMIANVLSAATSYTVAPIKPQVTMSVAIAGPVLQVQAAASTSNPGTTISAMKVYIDGIAQYSVNAPQLAVTFLLPAGAHTVTVNAWDNTGLSGVTAQPVVATNPTSVSILP